MAKFARPTSISSIDDCEMSDFLSDLGLDIRYSVISTDSGIDMGQGSSMDMETKVEKRLSRRGGMKVKPSLMGSMTLIQDTLGSESAFLSQQQPQRNFIANIVVMGDDRGIGRLARAFYRLRYDLNIEFPNDRLKYQSHLYLFSTFSNIHCHKASLES